MSISPSIINSCKGCTARCCRGLAVVLTIPEAKRLIADLGLPPEDFLEFTTNINSRETPHYPLLVKNGNAVEEYFIILKRRRKVECIFLQEDLSCGIYPHRPFVCRLYPFDLDAKRMKKNALCPMKFEREKGIEACSKRLEDDLVAHGLMAVRWSARHKGGAPDMRKFGEYF